MLTVPGFLLRKCAQYPAGVQFQLSCVPVQTIGELWPPEAMHSLDARAFVLFKGTALEGGFRVPAIVRWPGKVPAGKVENGIFSGLDWFPTLLAAAGAPNIKDELLKGKQLGDQNFKVHLDGYNQLDLLTGKGPSARHEIFYFTEGTLSAVRINDYKYRFTDQPNGWIGATDKLDWPILTNLRLDPFERTGMPDGRGGSLAFYDWFKGEFWRFTFVQKAVGDYAQSFVEYPPMQKGSSFNMEAVKNAIMEKMNQQNRAN